MGRPPALTTEIAFFEGRRYTRAKGKAYFKSQTWDKELGRYVTRYLHREVWRATFGEIPAGHHVHHAKDHDHNEIGDLELLSHAEHSRLHGRRGNAGQFKANSERQRQALDQRYLNPRTLICKECGQEFQGFYRQWCSPLCKSRHHERLRPARAR